jgi:hypothetical protein
LADARGDLFLADGKYVLLDEVRVWKIQPVSGAGFRIVVEAEDNPHSRSSQTCTGSTTPAKKVRNSDRRASR